MYISVYSIMYYTLFAGEMVEVEFGIYTRIQILLLFYSFLLLLFYVLCFHLCCIGPISAEKKLHKIYAFSLVETNLLSEPSSPGRFLPFRFVFPLQMTLQH